VTERRTRKLSRTWYSMAAGVSVVLHESCGFSRGVGREVLRANECCFGLVGARFGTRKER